MKIKGTEITRRTVEIDVGLRDLFVALRESIFKSLNLPIGTDIPYLDKDGQIKIEEEDWCGSHSSWTVRVVVPEPSSDQVAALKSFEVLSGISEKILRAPSE